MGSFWKFKGRDIELRAHVPRRSRRPQRCGIIALNDEVYPEANTLVVRGRIFVNVTDAAIVTYSGGE